MKKDFAAHNNRIRQKKGGFVMSKMNCSCCKKAMDSRAMQNCKGCNSYMCQDCFDLHSGYCGDCQQSLDMYE
jgi:hypothetical protein